MVVWDIDVVGNPNNLVPVYVGIVLVHKNHADIEASLIPKNHVNVETVHTPKNHVDARTVLILENCVDVRTVHVCVGKLTGVRIP